MITQLDLKKALAAYTKAAQESKAHIKSMAEEAEETDDYYDYDQASYDHYEHLAELGEILAAVVAEYLTDEWSI